jgi:hypothetical protein
VDVDPVGIDPVGIDPVGIDPVGIDQVQGLRCWMDVSHRIPFDGPRGALGVGSGHGGSLVTGSTDRAAGLAAVGGSVRTPAIE